MKGHTLELYTKDPYGYLIDYGRAMCDECKTGNCINMGYLFHCPTCKYDLCKKCDLDKNGKIINPLIQFSSQKLSQQQK